MATITINGLPLATFTFPHLPSWNESISKARGNKFKAAKDTANWRLEGCVAAKNWLKGKSLARPFFKQPVAIVARVWRKDKRRYDVHNICLKAVLDGFSDANLWQDDSSDYVPILMMMHMGINKLRPRVEISIYENR
jgi:Holliday junction resolvase RusA-like endonuclease